MEVIRPKQIKKDSRGNDPEEDKVFSRLKELDIKPNENLGQHFLINSSVVDQIVSFVTPGNNILEIGSGVGQLTEALTSRAARITGIEIDKRYVPVLCQLEETYPNVSVVYGDALTLKWEKYIPKRREGTNTQLISNLPYHISEPFFRKLAKMSLSFEDIVLILGKRLVDELKATSEDSPDFGALTLIAQTFFSIDHVASIGKDCFYPVPRTDSGLVRLSPKNPKEIGMTRKEHVFRQLYLTEDRNPSVVSILKDALVEFDQNGQKGTLSKSEYAKKNRRISTMNLKALVGDYNSYSQSSDDRTTDPHVNLLSAQHLALKRVSNMGIPPEILGKPFKQLNTSELRLLSKLLGQ